MAIPFAMPSDDDEIDNPIAAVIFILTQARLDRATGQTDEIQGKYLGTR